MESRIVTKFVRQSDCAMCDVRAQARSVFEKNAKAFRVSKCLKFHNKSHSSASSVSNLNQVSSGGRELRNVRSIFGRTCVFGEHHLADQKSSTLRPLKSSDKVVMFKF